MGFFRAALVVMMKDLRAELRTKEAINEIGRAHV